MKTSRNLKKSISKYKNVRTHGFASKREYARWQELKLLEKAGEITNLDMQVSYDLVVNGIKICRYISDFEYTQWDISGSAVISHKNVVEDCKGVRTPVYKLKAKLMKTIYGITIKET